MNLAEMIGQTVKVLNIETNKIKTGIVKSKNTIDCSPYIFISDGSARGSNGIIEKVIDVFYDLEQILNKIEKDEFRTL